MLSVPLLTTLLASSFPTNDLLPIDHVNRILSASEGTKDAAPIALLGPDVVKGGAPFAISYATPPAHPGHVLAQMPIAQPKPGVDYKLLVQEPKSGVDYKLLIAPGR